MSVKELTDILRKSNKTVFFGGAGVSTASDIPDFRSAEGLWNQQYGRFVSPEELVSHSCFERDPELFFSFYKEKLIYPKARPNACHKAVAWLEEMGKLSAVVTQNIDGLHQMAGSRVVHELHGSIHRNFCTRCHAAYDVDYILQAPGVPRCKNCGSIVKPDVVLYEEMLDENVVERAVRAIRQADCLIVGGTSLIVYPAAGFIHHYRGDRLVVINKTETQADEYANLVIHQDIAAIMEEAVGAL